MLKKNHSPKAGPLKNQQGFTLIEIIAVLIILGLLAAVAVPKYGELIQESRVKALDGAFASGQSNVNMAYSTFLLKSGGDTNATINSSGDAIEPASGGTPSAPIPTDLGDFTASYSDDGDDNVTITLNSGPEWFSDIDTANTTKTFAAPWK